VDVTATTWPRKEMMEWVAAVMKMVVAMKMVSKALMTGFDLRGV